MYFENFHAVLTMDGHGPYVWAAYAITLLVLALLLMAPVRRARLLRRNLAGQIKRAAQSPGQSEVHNASGS